MYSHKVDVFYVDITVINTTQNEKSTTKTVCARKSCSQPSRF